MKRAPTIHMIAPAHTCVDESFNHCAFTGKVLRFPKVCPPGYKLRIYGNAGTACASPVIDRIYTCAQLQKKLGPDLHEAATTKHCFNEAHKLEFNARVLQAIKAHARLGDIVAHPLGADTKELVAALPGMIHVETGIGYAAGPMGAYRIFESEHWRAWHMGRYTGSSGTWPDYPELTTTFVAPNYYDPSDWQYTPGALEPYALFVGRMTSDKGIEIIEWLARQNPSMRFHVVSGEARSDRLSAPNIEWRGRVDSRATMATIYANALCTIVPSRFQEPFGGVAVESLMCGTPVIASDFGAFTETVGPEDGLRCNVKGFNTALALMQRGSHQTDRPARRQRAIERFGVDTVRQIYTAHFDSIRKLYAAGIKPAGHP